jgi:Rrf2 family nitric oxide-sensitive transcriptional repressor
VISPVCGLKHALNKALQAYFAVLDQYTLADLVNNQNSLLAYFSLNSEKE